jgi:hypothetical protein
MYDGIMVNIYLCIVVPWFIQIYDGIMVYIYLCIVVQWLDSNYSSLKTKRQTKRMSPIVFLKNMCSVDTNILS